MKHLIRMADLSNAEIEQLLTRALAIKQGSPSLKRNDLFVANLFFENSTRTKHSFEVAETHLQLNRLNFDAETSSVRKGESLYDTCKTLEMLGCHLLVIRHYENDYFRQLHGLNIPVINAGDGSGEHPSQCLLDLMTIYEKFGYFEGLNVVIAGDIKNSRVARSNFHTLTRLGATVRFVGPETFADPSLGEMVAFDELIDSVDVCMLLRVQHERHGEAFDVQHYLHHYGLTEARYQRLPKQAIIMHPAPVNRGVEIASTLVESEKSVIFQQMHNGVFMRQAILEKVISDNHL